MALDYGDITVDVECGSCGRNTAKSIAALKRQPVFTCPNCGEKTRVSIDDRKFKSDLADIERSFKNMFK